MSATLALGPIRTCFLAERLGTILKNIAAFIFDLFVMIFAMSIFSATLTRLSVEFAAFCRLTRAPRDLMTQTRDLISASVTTSLILAHCKA